MITTSTGAAGITNMQSMNMLLRLIHVYGSCDIHGSKLISTPASGWRALRGHLLLPYVSLNFTLFVQFVQQWISARRTSMDQWLHSVFCCFFFFFYLAPHRIDSRARWSQREIKSLLSHLIYQRAEAVSTRVAWWIVLSMNRTVTQRIDFSVTEQFLVSPCGRWCSRTLEWTNVTALDDPAVVGLHHKPGTSIMLSSLHASF